MFARRCRRRAGAAVWVLRPVSDAPARGSPLQPPASAVARRAETGGGAGAGAGRAPGIGGPGPAPAPPRRRGAALAAHTHSQPRPPGGAVGSREGRAAGGTMSTGMRYKSKLVNPGEAAGRRGRSAPRPGASLPPHSLFFSLPAAGSRRGHPALAAPPCRGEAGRWAAPPRRAGRGRAARPELCRADAQWGGVLPPGHGGVSARGWASWTVCSWACPGNGRSACLISLGTGLRGFGWFFFPVPLGALNRFGWRNAAQGLAKAFQYEEHVSPPLALPAAARMRRHRPHPAARRSSVWQITTSQTARTGR